MQIRARLATCREFRQVAKQVLWSRVKETRGRYLEIRVRV